MDIDDNIARMALAQYDLGAKARHEFVRHSQARVFCVKGEAGAKFALRLHQPISTHLAGELIAAPAIRSEMKWLDHLFRVSGLPVQEPMRARSGDWTAAVRPDGGEAPPVLCTLHRWIEGDIADDLRPTEERVRAAAALLARLHDAAADWSAPADFQRPRYDAARARQALDTARPLVAKGVIERADFAAFEQCLENIAPVFASLESDPAQWGLIHGDYWMANIVFRPDGSAAVIDFSECGWGAIAQDLSAMLLKIGRWRAAFLDEYQRHRPLPAEPVRVCEAFIIVNFVAWMAFLASVPERHERLTKWIPGIAHYFCAPYRRGESFLIDESTFTVRQKPQQGGIAP